MNGHISNIDHCFVIDLNISKDMTFEGISMLNAINIPFKVERVYYLYGVPENESRGAHAHKELYQIIIALNGSLDVVLDDGTNKKRFTLNRPNQGLLVVPGMWRDLENFSSGSVCLVLASMVYTEADYIRDYDEFVRFKNI